MRLINTSTIQVEEFLGHEIPEYVILSHTWEEEEVSLQDIQSFGALKKKGYTKIEKCCEKAASDGFTYCWIDTCCIDKTSSAELSEAINSMYKWYQNSRICYAYLSDFEASSGSLLENYMSFTASRWWTRGWTLQELLAPNVVEFYNADWIEIGTKLSLHEQITEITGIDEGVLCGADPLRRNVAVRMSWASHRKTTRIEDQAYCLMGLFRVNMPLLYGEGNRAFIRLQEKIMRVREDYTLFTWSPSIIPGYSDPHISKGLLADSPSDFVDPRGVWTKHSWTKRDLAKTSSSSWSFRDLSRDCSSLLSPPKIHDPPYLTSRGLRISLPLLERNNSGEFYACLTSLHAYESDELMLCMTLHRLSPKSERYIRRVGADLTLLPKASCTGFNYTSIYVLQPFAILDRNDLIKDYPGPASIPSLVIVKPNIAQELHLEYYLSSWISMDRVISARFPTDSSTKSRLESTISTVMTSSSDGNLYRHRVNKLVNALRSLDKQTTVALSMNNPPELCWFSDVDTFSQNLRTSRIRGVLGFGLRDETYHTGAFLVQLGLYEERPLCNVVSISLSDLKNEALYRQWSEEAQQSTLHSDRMTIHLNTKEEEGTEKAGLEIAVSVRRIATAKGGIRRVVLEIAQKSVGFPPVLERKNTEELSKLESLHIRRLEI
jgi:hypothetical protein